MNLQIPSHNSRTVNIPSEGELQEILDLLGFGERAEFVGKLSFDLEKKRHSTDALPLENMRHAYEIFLAGKMSLEALEDFSQSYVPKSGFEKFSAVGKSDEEINNYFYAFTILGRRESGLAKQERTVKSLYKAYKDYKDVKPTSDTEQLDHEFDVFFVGVSLLYLNFSIVEESYISKQLMYHLPMFLAYPSFLLTQNNSFQEDFFLMFFTHLDESVKEKEYKDPDSVLWKYLDSYFLEIPCVSTYHPTRKLGGENTNRKVASALPSESLNRNLDKGELLEVLTIFETLERLRDCEVLYGYLEKYGNLGKKCSTHEDLLLQNSRDISFSFVSGSLDSRILDQDIQFLPLKGSMDGSDSFYRLLVGYYKESRTGEGQKNILSKISRIFASGSIATSGGFGNELRYLITAILLLKFLPRTVHDSGILKGEHAGMILLSPILYPGYIQNTTPKEQEKFFKGFFRYFGDQCLREHDFLRKYFLKFFGGIAFVKEKLEKITRQSIAKPVKNKPKKPKIRRGTCPKVPSKNTIDTVPSPVEKDPIILPQISSENTRISIDGTSCTIETDVSIPEGASLYVGVWNRTKTKLANPRFREFDGNDPYELEVDNGQVITVGVFESGMSFNTSLYRQYALDFPTIRPPINSQRHSYNWSASDKNAKQPASQVPSKNGRGTPQDKTEEVSTDTTPLRDAETLQIGVALALEDDELNISYVLYENGYLHIIFPTNTSCIDESGYGDIATSREIVYDTNIIPATLISFFGMKDFVVSDGELSSIIESKLLGIQKERVKQEREERKKLERKAHVSLLKQIPDDFKQAKVFFSLADIDHREIIKNGDVFKAWSLIPGKEVISRIMTVFQELGYTIGFSQGDRGEISQISINGTSYSIVDHMDPTDIVPLDGDVEHKKVLEYILSYIMYSVYKNSHGEVEGKRFKETNTKVSKYNTESDTDRENLIRKFRGELKGTGIRFADGWRYFGEDISPTHPEIHDYPLLVRAGSLKVKDKKIKSETHRIQEKTLVDELESDDDFCEYIFDRCMSRDFQASNVQAVVTLYMERLKTAQSLEEKRAVCIDIMIKLSRQGFSLELAKPSVFEFFEIEDEL